MQASPISVQFALVAIRFSDVFNLYYMVSAAKEDDGAGR